MKDNLCNPFYLPSAPIVPNYLSILPGRFQIDTRKDMFHFAATNPEGVHVVAMLTQNHDHNDDQANDEFYQSLNVLVMRSLVPERLIPLRTDMETSLNILKEGGNTFYKKGDFDKAVCFYTNVIVVSFLRIQPLEDTSNNPILMDLYDLLTICINNRAATRLEQGKYHRALADSCFVISQLFSIHTGTKTRSPFDPDMFRDKLDELSAMKKKRLLVQDQIDSKTIVDSFSRLLRRAG
eukprot:sb/3469203/